MLGFAAVQYNDPDWYLWVVYYLVPAVWALVAAFRHRLRAAHAVARRWLWACVAVLARPRHLLLAHDARLLAQGGVDGEVKGTAREGMGLMIALGVLPVALLHAPTASGDAGPTEPR